MYTIFRDLDGNRLVRCEFCGKIVKSESFSSYGGLARCNLGACKECSISKPSEVYRKSRAELARINSKEKELEDASWSRVDSTFRF